MTRRANTFLTQKRTALFRFFLGGAVALMQFSAVASQSVTLTWNPSVNTNVAGYKIYYGAASLTYTNSITVGNVTNTTVTGLADDTTYFFAATTYDSTGAESEFSNEASYQTGGTNVNVVSTNSTSGSIASQPPALNAPGNLKISENAGTQVVNLSGISLGTGSQMAFTAVSSNPALIPNPAVNYTSPSATGTLIFAPAVDASGTATITVTANNGQVQNNLVTKTFTVTVNAVNQPPTLNPLNNLNLNINSGSQIVVLSGITSGAANEKQTLRVSAVSSNRALIPNPMVNYISPNSTGKLIFKPAANAIGTATITVTVNDGGKSNNIVTQKFTVTVAKAVVANKLSGQIAAPSQPATLASAASANGQFTFMVSCVPNYQYIVQASSDLVNWTSLQTNNPTSASFTVTDTNASQFKQRFYRTVCP
jgi:hypothetical protein